MPIFTVKATSKLVKGLQVDSSARGFSIRMDEPEDGGGTDTGMTTVEALLCAYGSCLVILFAAFARLQDFDLKDCWVELEGDIDPEGCNSGKPGVRMGYQEVRLTPHFKTKASPEEVKKFAAFALSRCPVGDIMANGTRVIPADVVIE